MNSRYFNFEIARNFDGHKDVTFVFDKKNKLKGFIAIHRGGFRLPSFGATRVWSYDSVFDALEDALKLSKVMSYKSALAGLPYGGAKAVLFNSFSSRKSRDLMLKTYSQHVNLFNGRFITGADVGISEADLKVMSSGSKFIVGLKVDPIKYTALGVFYGMQVALKEIFGSESVSNRTFAIQGLGKTGVGILKLIYTEASRIYVSDINAAVVKSIKEKFPKVEVVEPSEIHKQKVDVYAPCALSNAINRRTISSLHCKIIAGSANVQLEDSGMGEILSRLGILYAPDYVVNAGGLIAVVDEYENSYISDERILKRVGNIKHTLKTIIAKSKRSHRSTSAVADEMAKKISDKFE